MPANNYVRWFLEAGLTDFALVGAKRNGRHIGICGEAPADYPEIAHYPAPLGINSICVNPSSILRTMEIVAAAEEMAGQSGRSVSAE